MKLHGGFGINLTCFITSKLKVKVISSCACKKKPYTYLECLVKGRSKKQENNKKGALKQTWFS